MVWIWIGIGAVCGLIELFTVTFFGLWMAIAALIPAAAVLMVPELSFTAQIGIWCLSTLCCALAWVKWSRLKPEQYVEEPLVGQVGILASAIQAGGRSVILLTKPVQGNQQWPCQSEVALPKETRVYIVGVAEGVVQITAVNADIL